MTGHCTLERDLQGLVGALFSPTARMRVRRRRHHDPSSDCRAAPKPATSANSPTTQGLPLATTMSIEPNQRTNQRLPRPKTTSCCSSTRISARIASSAPGVPATTASHRSPPKGPAFAVQLTRRSSGRRHWQPSMAPQWLRDGALSQVDGACSVSTQRAADGSAQMHRFASQCSFARYLQRESEAGACPKQQISEPLRRTHSPPVAMDVT